MVPLSQVSPSDSPTIADGVSQPPRSVSRAQEIFRQLQPVLETGFVLAQRYEIVQTLGEGGMGAVYKAKDLELDRLVALKVIRPELARNPAIIERFKQELLLSQRVTHRNVIRIYDLGEGDGVKFITMEFIEGRDLRNLIQERKKFPPEEAVDVMEQVSLALDAAHSVEVIHRDLKPQNVMLDKTGRVLVMDFGLARTLEGEGMTQTGALVGTMEYMSPEQALAKELDQRSDIFSAGLIFYELLSGQMPYRADSALASLIRRTQEPARPISELDNTVPQALSNIVGRCLEREPAARYPSAKALLSDLEAWQGKRTAGAIAFPSVKPWGQTVPWPWLGGILAAIILAVVGYTMRGNLFSPNSSKHVATVPGQSLAILPFHNASGDPAWDWLGPSLGDMLSTDVGQSAHLRAVSPDRLQQVLHDLRITPGASLDPATLRRVAEFANADIVVSGQYVKLGEQIRIDATLQDLKRGRTESLKSEAQSQQALSGAVDYLADAIRQNLALSPDLIKELQAQSFKPTSTSVEALRDYNQGLQLARQGSNLEALKQFRAAVKEDPQFALAYSRLGETYSALGYGDDAEQASRRAVELSDALPVSEKYLIEASHARVVKDNKKAIENYENLARSAPDDLDVQFALGGLYQDQGDYAKAREHYGKVLSADPKNLQALLSTGWLEVVSGTPQAGLDPLNRALTLAIEVDNREQKAQILQAIGVAYEGLNKSDEAVRNLQQAVDINRQLGNKSGVANGLAEIAHVQRSLGKPDAALASYNEALRLEQEIADKKGAADTLLDMGQLAEDRGQPDQALQLYKRSLQMQRETGDESNQALCLNNIANVYLAKGQNDDALTYYQQALQLREKLGVEADIAETLHNLGEGYAQTGQFDNAISSYMKALQLRRTANDSRGAAMDSHGMGMVFVVQGRYGAAVTSLQDAAKSFRDLGDRTRAMAEILNDYGSALALAGRGSEAGKILGEAQGLARELKNDTVLADILNAQGDVQAYQGNLKAAKDLYQRALQSALSAKAQKEIVLSKLNLGRVAIAEGQAQSASASLRPLTGQAEALGLKALSLQCSVALAEALIKGKDYAHARQQLEQSLGQSDKLGSRMETARIQYLLGTSLRLDGKGSDGASHYREAVRILDEIKKEPGAQDLLQRADLKSLYEEAIRRASSKA